MANSRALMALAAALTLAACVTAGPAFAEIYKWTDADGTVRFTNRLENVPAASQAAIERMGQRVRRSQRLQFTHPRSSVAHSALESTATEAVVPFLREGSLMKVNVRINENLVEPFYVDTGASSVVIPERVARALDLDIGASAQRELALTPGGIVEMKVVQLASVDLNGAKVNNLRTLVSNQLEIGLLGGAFLRHFNYSVNSDGGMIVLEPASRGETRH